MTAKTEVASLAAVIGEIKARFKSAQASLGPLRGTEGFGGGYGLGYHDALGEMLEFIRDLPPESSPEPDASIPTYGKLPWKQLGRDVVEAQIGIRRDFEYREGGYPGHDMTGINFNSLARIVDKYRLASSPLSRPELGGR